MANTPIRRCAIYTRKSTDEGLEQDYNSLHAQREACEAFIKSQAGEGWRLVSTAYDDGGFSGGNMERPALQQLLADIRKGLVGVVVVYKVDRLTRALADFAKIVEPFDAQRVSFVAVTQQFNTTTSMGRLILNVLLSFAQFERELIGERIRDKVAASKRKGMWMGGTRPLGYDVRERKLIVNQAEADTVRYIFKRYLELARVPPLMRELMTRGIVSGIKVSKSGNSQGGKPFSRGGLYHLLGNPVYVGEIPHKHDRHPGQHEPILSRELWEQVQEKLRGGAVRHGEGHKTAAARSPLAGKLFDDSGDSLYVQGAAKGGRHYRYYVSKRLVLGDSRDAGKAWRVSAPEIERLVRAAVGRLLGGHGAIAQALDESGIHGHRLPSVLESASAWLERLRSERESGAALAQLADRVDLKSNGIQVMLKLPIPTSEEDDGAHPTHLALARFMPMHMKRRGVEMRLVLEGDTTARRVDLSLLKAIARARRWSQDLIYGRVQAVGELAKREGLDRRSVRRLLRLAFLSPRVAEAIVEGRQPPDLTVIKLTRRIDLPPLWSAQEQALGMR
jgi:DNA invertase Pin-like site-specific DNA recombinase